MIKRLQKMNGPTLMLWLYVVVATLGYTMVGDEREPPPRAELSERLAFTIALSCWVAADARKRGRRLCYDYDTFVFFAWPVLVPVYLFQTRGARAFLTLLCFAGMWLFAIITAALVVVARELATP